MSDLISRQAAIDAIGKTADELYKNIKKGATFPQRQWFDGMAHAQSILEDLPSAQSEIIRCRDCKEYCAHDHRCRWWNHGTKEAGWCSYAERREE